MRALCILRRMQKSLIELINTAVERFADRPAYSCLGKTMTFHQWGEESGAFAAWLDAQGLSPDARVAVMLPNIFQHPVAISGILRSGRVVVNVNPLYTPRELAQQLNDSGAEIIVLLENFAHTLQQAEHRFGLPAVKQVVITQLGDRLGLKGLVVNAVVRYVKRLIPRWHLPKRWRQHRWNDLLKASWHQPVPAVVRQPEDLAFLQYTGGTTGVAKGAMLTHGNILANLDQCESWLQPELLEQELQAQRPSLNQPPSSSQRPSSNLRQKNAPLTMVCALPLYHIFSLTACMMLGLKSGFRNLLLPNPRDLKSTIQILSQEVVHLFPGVNTLFNALLNHPDIGRANFSQLRVTVGGGMAVSSSVAARWQALTGCPMLEGYGLSETSPVVAATPRTLTEFTGTVGIPMPETEVRLIDEAGNPVEGVSDLTDGSPTGEIVVRGPQVMAGYWHQPRETAQAFTADGFFKTGDIGQFDANGYLKIMDRKKDMILVSGFNVYPNEIEQVVSELPGVAECAAVGVPDDACGEAVRLFLVKKDEALTALAVRRYCTEHLTNYKRPRDIVFKKTLPKSAVGKVLRRALREDSDD